MASSSAKGNAIIIRPATMADCIPMHKCNLAVLPENYDMSFYMDHIRNSPGMSHVAYDPSVPGGGKVVGYILAKVEDEHTTTPWAWITSLGVYPSHRQMGLARRLMEASHQVMHEKFKVPYSKLHVRVSNKIAQHLYEVVMDYKRFKLEPRYYEDGEDAYELRKDVRQTTHYDHRHRAHALVLTPTPYGEQKKNWQCDHCLAPGLPAQSSYHCATCNYDLHPQCAKPSTTTPLPLTLNVMHHSCVLTLITNPYGADDAHVKWKCDVCFHNGDGPSYHCRACRFDMHPICQSRAMIPRVPSTSVVAPPVLTIGTPRLTSQSSSPSLNSIANGNGNGHHNGAVKIATPSPLLMPASASATSRSPYERKINHDGHEIPPLTLSSSSSTATTTSPSPSVVPMASLPCSAVTTLPLSSSSSSTVPSGSASGVTSSELESLRARVATLRVAAEARQSYVSGHQ